MTRPSTFDAQDAAAELPSEAPGPRAPWGWVVWNPTPSERDAEVDWSPWYLTDEDDMGESGEHDYIITLLRSVLFVLARERGWTEEVHIGSDQFFAWRREQPLVRISPDLYLVDHPPAGKLPEQWETWRDDHPPPRFALEVVSRTEWRKDYESNPPKYAQLGAAELVIFDPWALPGITAERTPLQVFRRTPEGALVRVYAGLGPARSESLEAWLTICRQGAHEILRLSRDPKGRELVPSTEELVEDKDRALQQALAELERLKRQVEPE